VQPDGLGRAAVDLLAEEKDEEVPPSCRRAVAVLARLIDEHPDLFEAPHRTDSAGWIGARLAEVLPLDPLTKQALLEMDDVRARLERVNAMLGGAAKEP
jgi:uncharacterized protein